jgi:hypothetical protein
MLLEDFQQSQSSALRFVACTYLECIERKYNEAALRKRLDKKRHLKQYVVHKPPQLKMGKAPQ